ncbi:hypothetical protein U5T60_22080 [Klebsiella quasipneumoniae subsp. quasipneumoniae]|uniref:hypothetical protein n=1 Tax=Klebsiella quasipneumoniae TaxID=1463165 RepID=UPI003014B60A
MTKSTITRERIQRIIRAIDSEAYDEEEIREWLSSDEIMELARIALAVMDCEPVATLDVQSRRPDGNKFALVFSSAAHKLPDDVYFLYRHAQPVTEYPEVLPCSVLLEPGLRFGKGIKTSTMLAALARRAVYESDMAALSPEERADFQARIEDLKSLIAQPVPAVPEEITIETATIIAYGLPTTNIGAIFKAGHDACRVAMLKAQPQNAPQNIPEIIPNELIAAVNRLLDSNGSRGCYNAIKCYDAHIEVERLLAAARQEVKP